MPTIFLLVALLVQTSQTPGSGEITAPREWVAFSADLKGTGPQGPFQGRFYRGADGSTRKETGRPGQPIDTVVIVNVPRGEQYTCRKACATRSVKPRPTPPRFQSSLPGLTKLDKRIEGYEAYEWKSGIVSTLLPALNFFTAEVESSSLTETYSNFKVGQQPAELFEPPPQKL